MSYRVTDLRAWALDRKAAVKGLPRATQTAAKRCIPVLLAAGLRHAPRHTGALRRSLRVAMRSTRAGYVHLALISDDPAAKHQEEGGPIYARRELMTVPIGAERAMWDATGTRRNARDVPGLFRIRARDGRYYLATRNGRSLVLRFALRDRVFQRAQHWATKATAEAAGKMEPRVRAVYQAALLGGGEHRP